MSASAISVIVDEPAWKKSGVWLSRVKTAVRVALASPFLPHAGRQSSGGSKSRARPPPPFRGTSPTLCAGKERSSRVSLLLTNDERLRALNARFRGKDSPTNVLSFPAESADGYLGDIAIAFGVTSRESTAAGISLEAHTLHLAVHGVLHLLGYDHVRNSEARIMEELEIEILDQIEIPNPYARGRDAR